MKMNYSPQNTTASPTVDVMTARTINISSHEKRFRDPLALLQYSRIATTAYVMTNLATIAADPAGSLEFHLLLKASMLVDV